MYATLTLPSSVCAGKKHDLRIDDVFASLPRSPIAEGVAPCMPLELWPPALWDLPWEP